MIMAAMQEVKRLKKDEHLLQAVKQTVIYIIEMIEKNRDLPLYDLPTSPIPEVSNFEQGSAGAIPMLLLAI